MEAYWNNNGVTKWKHKLQTFLLTLFCIVLISFGFIFIWKTYYSEGIYFSNKYTGLTIVSLYTILFYILAELYQTFKISIKKISEMIYSGVLSVLLSTIVIYIVIFLLKQSFPNLKVLILHLIIQIAIIVLWSLISHKIYF